MGLDGEIFDSIQSKNQIGFAIFGSDKDRE